ncbi:hypothetical protein C474_04830 [Halogeometricum pallidum JCM 14848]|uniref:Uncharacterized protein n=1 Tax=Halogeometricum pallidum JCM 14848 TaxID=1227487 RepID=M0DD13_HALPD|nr:hypothetical protein [Halogeometricum pallidum]ELZ33376.1 hypothetical protein C474_04830 [Halogeometricum pallidum JCM 14848]
MTDDLSTENRLRERTGVNKYLFWVLLGVNRRVIIGALALVVFLTFVGAGVLKPVSLRATMETSDMVETLFSGLVGAIITSTTLVVSINQLVLSQEIGSLGTQRNRMDVTMDFYQNTDELLGKTTPSDPAVLLAEVIEVCVQRARALRDAVEGNDSEEFRDRIGEYVADLEDNADTAMSELEDSDFGTFNVVSPALDFNYARKMYDARRLGEQYEPEMSEDERGALRNVLEGVTMYGPLREYVKVLYLQWALVKLSRAILYASVPALVIAGAVVIFVDPNTFTGTILGLETILWVVSAAFTVSVLPFLVFIAYVLRLATLAKQTLTVGSLILS